MRAFIYLLLIACIVFIFGCSGGGDPVTTNGTDATEFERGSSSNSFHKLLGLWQGVINPDEKILEFVQLRAGDFHLNALQFLEPPPFLNLTLESLVFNGNLVEADIGLRHPFLGLTEFTGFDVCGIFITNGSTTGFDDPDLRMAGDSDTRLLNPDGYSRWWNPAEFPVNDGTMFSYKDGLLGTPDAVGHYNSTLNGYKYFCDGLGPNDTLDNVVLERRGLFSAGQKNIRHYTIEMGAGLIFNYAIDACWVFPTGNQPWMAPDDFPPAANRSEAWNIAVKELYNTLWNDGIDNGGNFKLQVDVYDWFNAELNQVKVESPGNFPPVTSTTAIGGGEGFSTYEIEVLDATPAEGSIDLLISVESENVGYGDLLPGKPVTAYFSHNIEVSNEQPVLWPVLIDDDNNYWSSRFVEDSNGVFHVVASWVDVSPDWQIRWFISTDHGHSWESKGDLANPPSIAGAFSPSNCYQLAADQDGGVYLLYGENKSYPGGPIVGGFLKYLDTSTAGLPSEWNPSLWQSKRVFTIDYAVGAQQCAITVTPSNEILMMVFDWRYCDGDRGLKFNYAPDGWDSVIDGSSGSGVDPSLIATGTGKLHYVYPSGANNVVYHSGSGHFFYCIGGSLSYSGSSEYVGACVLEFDPDAVPNQWTMAAAFQNPGMGNGNSIMQNYHGDLAVDSSGDVHWVHVSTYPASPIVYSYDHVQFRFVHGVRDNLTGNWDMSDTPINGTWDFPSSPPGGTPNNRPDYEAAYVNLVNTSNGILLSWLQSCNYPNYRSSLLTPGGSFSEPAIIQLSASEYPIVVPSALLSPNTGWAGAQGEAVDDELALPFASKEFPTDARGQLWFTMFSGM